MTATGIISQADHQRLRNSAGNHAVQQLAPAVDRARLNTSTHFAQFYESDSFLLASLSDFILPGLRNGEAAIIVATQAHRAGLAALLQASGLDVAAARASGQLVLLDAAELLAGFMVDGSPEHGRFTELVGGIIAHSTATWQRVRIFGEMVALLWAEGNHDGAIHLEAVWNTLQDTHAFVLFCAYPIASFDGATSGRSISDVCATHSHVIPAESYSALTSSDDRLRTIIQLQQQARLLQAEIAERKEAEAALLTLKNELQVQVIETARLHQQVQQELEAREQALSREQSARAEAESASRMKDEFLATVSHELRTPLTAIIGWSSLLQRSIQNGRFDLAKMARTLEIIERNAHAQAQLVEDILDVSRVITGQLNLTMGPVDIAAVINAAIDSVQPAADAKSIDLEVRLDLSARHIAGDGSRLQQVVWNLLANAIKFTPAHGHVTLRLQRAGSHVQISVSDTGEGISADVLPFIFDRFRQADSTSTRRHGGLGLGLAIVRHLVELHGGTVEATSAGEGCGATFTIRLPRALIPEQSLAGNDGTGSLLPAEALDDQVQSLPSLEGIQVLLVDDDGDTLQVVTAILIEAGASVQVAGSAAEALAMLAERYTPDVLVSDIAMPDENGHSLIGKVRAQDAARGKRTPAVALTAYARAEDRSRAIAAGFNFFVPKPIDADELIRSIARLAERSPAPPNQAQDEASR